MYRSDLWIEKYNINDIILVTDSWHMPYSLDGDVGFMPNIKISPSYKIH